MKKVYSVKYAIFLSLFVALFLGFQTASASILFQDDSFADVDSEGLILDALDQASGDITIQFGTTLGEFIQWNATDLRFEISDDLDFNSNQLIEARVENITALPGGGAGLGAGGIGRIVELTATDSTAPGCTVAPNCPVGTYVWNGATWDELSGGGGSAGYAQTVTVAKSGGDFTSLKAAVDSITDATTAKRYVVHVYPGTYIEAPITVPDYVSIKGLGNLSNIIIVAASPTGTLIDAGDSSFVENITLTGAAGAGGICGRADGATAFSFVQLASCETGILATGGSASVRVLNVAAQSGTFTDIVKYTGGATGGVSQYAVTGVTAANALVVSGTGTQIAVANTAIKAPLVTNGIFVNDSANVEIGNVTVQFTDNGLRIGPTGTSIVNGSGGVITNNQTYDFFSESTTSKIYYSGVVANKNKFNLPAAMTNVITFNDDTPDDEALNVLGELNVGIPEEGQESLFGEGDSYTDGMLVYAYNGSTYSDVTTAAQSATGSTFSYPGTGVNNALYISSNRKDSLGNFVKFGGYRYLTAGTAASGGAIVHEYWNGSSWTSFDVMCLHSTLLYRYDNSCHQRANSNEYALFDNTMKSNWALNDPPSTGTNRYWIRVRITSSLSTAPLFEQFKINPNSTQINSAGTFTFLGDSRYRKTFITGPEMLFYAQGSNSPDNTAFTVGTFFSSFTMERAQSAFTGNSYQIEETTGSIALPRGIDTSNPVTVRIYWKKSNNNGGNVQWHLDYTLAGARNVQAVDGSNIPTAPRAAGEDIDSDVSITTIETSPTGSGISDDEVILSEFTTPIDINGYYEGDPLYIRLYRDAADSDDTYTSDAIMVGFEMSGVFWTLGEKL